MNVMSHAGPMELVVLGIQPGRTDTGEPLSEPVAAAVQTVVHAIRGLARDA